IIWRKALAHWLTCQNPDGGFGYSHNVSSTGSMTCAGITSLIITAGKLTDGDARIKNGKVQCCGAQMSDQPLEAAIKWMGSHFKAQFNPGPELEKGVNYWNYYMYGLERAGRLTGRRFFGDHDWYREGAEVMVAKQNRDGSWDTEKDGAIAGTAMCL